MSESTCLSISKFDYNTVIREVEKRVINEKVLYLKTIPEFNSIGLSRNKMVNMCKQFESISCIKTTILYKEGEPCKYVYLVRSGELKISVKIIMP